VTDSAISLFYREYDENDKTCRTSATGNVIYYATDVCLKSGMPMTFITTFGTGNSFLTTTKSLQDSRLSFYSFSFN
jgi:hypothetical protein